MVGEGIKGQGGGRRRGGKTPGFRNVSAHPLCPASDGGAWRTHILHMATRSGYGSAWVICDESTSVPPRVKHYFYPHFTEGETNAQEGKVLVVNPVGAPGDLSPWV